MRKITETVRLQLVAFESQDADLLHLLTANEQVMRFFPKALTKAETEDMLQETLDHYARHGHCFWKILLKPKAQFIGIAGWGQEENRQKTTQLGFVEHLVKPITVEDLNRVLS